MTLECCGSPPHSKGPAFTPFVAGLAEAGANMASPMNAARDSNDLPPRTSLGMAGYHVAGFDARPTFGHANQNTSSASQPSRGRDDMHIKKAPRVSARGFKELTADRIRTWRSTQPGTSDWRFDSQSRDP